MMTTDKAEVLTMGGSFLFCGILLAIAAGLWCRQWMGQKAEDESPQEIGPSQERGALTLGHFQHFDLAVVAVLLAVWMGLWGLQAAAEKLIEEVPKTGLSLGTFFNGLMLQMMMAAIPIGLLTWRVNLLEFWGVKWRQWWLGPLVAVGCLAVFFSGNIVLKSLGYDGFTQRIYGESQQDLLGSFLKTESIFTLILMSFLAACVAPICEELLFRGYLYPALKRFGGPWIAGAFNVLLFALIHFQASMLLPFFILGSLLVWSYEFTRSLWTPILLHGLNNSVVVAVMWVQYFSDGPKPPVPS